MIRFIKPLLEKTFALFNIEIKLRKINKDYYKINGLNCINIGAGNFNNPNWINLDLGNRMYKKSKNHITYNILDMKQLPFKNNSLDLIYSSNVIEHVTDESLKYLFKECYKKLKKDGMIRLVCPDAKLLYNYYKEKDRGMFNHIKNYCYGIPKTDKDYKKIKIIKDPSIQQLFLHTINNQSTIYFNRKKGYFSDETIDKVLKNFSFEKALNYFTKKGTYDLYLQNKIPEEHINWFTEKKLLKMLKKAGFKKVYRSGHKQSLSKFMRGKDFDNTTPATSLYVEAKK